MGKQVKKIEEEAIEFLKEYRWPGNIRELENMIERLIILDPDEEIGIDQVKKNLLTITEPQDGIEGFIEKHPKFKDSVDSFEKLIIERAIKNSAGHIQKAADKLGISRHALRYQMNKLGIKIRYED